MAENRVDGETARRLLGHPGPPISPTFYSALRKAMGIGAQRYVLVSEIRAWWKKHPEFKVRDSYPKRRGDGSLFIPLRAEFFEGFRNGSKEIEYRPYGPRWNERTCKPGRAVILSRGYSTRDRLRGKVAGFAVQEDPGALPGWKECYGNKHSKAACITIQIEAARDSCERIDAC